MMPYSFGFLILCIGALGSCSKSSQPKSSAVGSTDARCKNGVSDVECPKKGPNDDLEDGTLLYDSGGNEFLYNKAKVNQCVGDVMKQEFLMEEACRSIGGKSGPINCAMVGCTKKISSEEINKAAIDDCDRSAIVLSYVYDQFISGRVPNSCASDSDCKIASGVYSVISHNASPGDTFRYSVNERCPEAVNLQRQEILNSDMFKNALNYYNTNKRKSGACIQPYAVPECPPTEPSPACKNSKCVMVFKGY